MACCFLSPKLSRRPALRLELRGRARKYLDIFCHNEAVRADAKPYFERRVRAAQGSSQILYTCIDAKKKIGQRSLIWAKKNNALKDEVTIVSDRILIVFFFPIQAPTCNRMGNKSARRLTYAAQSAKNKQGDDLWANISSSRTSQGTGKLETPQKSNAVNREKHKVKARLTAKPENWAVECRRMSRI